MSDANSILQRQVNALLARVAQLEGKPVSVGVPLQVRLAVTRPQPGGSYPNPATNPDTYWLRFVDGTFTEAQGTQTVTKYQRTTDPTVVARNVNGSASFVQQDSLVLAVRYSNRWWFSYSAPGMNLYPVYFNADLPRGGSASVTIMQWNAGLGVLEATGATVTAYDVCKSGPANQFDIGYVVLNPDSNRYEIVELPSRTGIRLFLFYLDAPLTRGGSAPATIRQWPALPLTGGPWAATGVSVTVHDSSSLGPAPQSGDATKHAGVVWHNDDSGRYEIIAVNRSAILWAKATAKWTNAANNASTVACHMCTDKTGTLLLDGLGNPIPITVYLPRPDGGTFKKATDPNVQVDDVIGYVIDDGGDCICITDVNDDCIGSVKFWNDVLGNIPRGWRRITGAEGKYTVAVGAGEPPEFDPSTLGATGGTTKHKHKVTATGTISTETTGVTADLTGTATITGSGIVASGDLTATVSGSGSVDTSFATASLTVVDTGHAHDIAVSGGTPNLTFGVSPVTIVNAVGGTTNGTGVTQAETTGITLTEPNSGSGHKHTVAGSGIASLLTVEIAAADLESTLSLSGSIDVTGLTVDITDPGHDHDFTGDEVDTDEKYHVPPFYALYLIERFE